MCFLSSQRIACPALSVHERQRGNEKDGGTLEAEECENVEGQGGKAREIRAHTGQPAN